MFANFIYFIIALLIYTLYQPAEELPLSLNEALSLFVGLALLFAYFTRTQFLRLARSAPAADRALLDHRFTLLVARHSILALVLFAVDIWGLNLPSYLAPVRWLSHVPTVSTLLFLLVFVFYLFIVWVFAYDAHRPIYRSDISRVNYVYSNAAFSLPILIPWTLLFGLSDLLRLLPFELPKRILDTAVGQTGYFLIFLVVAAIFAPLLIQRFWRCRPLEAGTHRARIEALCQHTGIRYADILYWPIFGGRMITAGVMGLVSRFRYILVTDALLQILKPEEIDQVIAHEIGHVKRKHLLLYMLFFVGFMLVSYAAFPLSYFFLFFVKPVLQLILMFDLNPANFIYTLYAVLLVIGVIVYFRYIFGYFMRNFERQADLFVFRVFSTAQPLISTFGKIVASSGQPANKPNWHHFSIQQRVDYLHRCEQSPVWIDRHDRKVRNSLVVYLAGFIIMAFAVFQLNQMVFSQGSRQLSLATMEAYLAQKDTKTTEDALLYLIVGNIHFERQNMERAAAAYEAALNLNPNDPDTLNNLAWLLATSGREDLRDPARALAMARKAITLKKAPHIWDTLAETLYANGRIQEAIEAEKRALAMNPEDRSIYEAQLEKFKSALPQ